MLSGKRTGKQVKFIMSYQIFHVCNQTGKNLLNISTFYVTVVCVPLAFLLDVSCRPIL
jgi:hypothetical protein